MELRKVLPMCVCTIPTAIIFIAGGLTWIFTWPLILDYMIVLRPNSGLYNLWQKMPVTIQMDFYFFNWTNPEDIFNKSVKPKFEEVGPYKFHQTEEKCNITWNENGTISYQMLKYWYYNNTSGSRDLQDMITSINPVVPTAGYITRYWSYLLRKAVSAILTNLSPTIDIKRTAGQFLFEGYRDPYIDVSKALPFLFDEFLHDWEKFGWMYKRNGSYEFDGSFNIGSGKRSTFGKLYNWNHWTNTPFFDDPCSKVAESTGQFFERNLGEGFISAFSTDIRRTVFLKYVGKEKVFNILANKYILEDLTLDNGTIYPQNKCYCGGDCVPSGVLNISSVRKTGPLFVSLPHFHRADSYYLNSVEGLRPDKDKHEAFIIIEPTIGVPLEVHLKGQINLLLEPVSGISILEGTRRIFFPVLWGHLSAKMRSEDISHLNFFLNIPTICISLGSSMILLGCNILFFVLYKKFTTESTYRKKKSAFLKREEHLPLEINAQCDMRRNVHNTTLLQ